MGTRRIQYHTNSSFPKWLGRTTKLDERDGQSVQKHLKKCQLYIIIILISITTSTIWTISGTCLQHKKYYDITSNWWINLWKGKIPHAFFGQQATYRTQEHRPEQDVDILFSFGNTKRTRNFSGIFSKAALIVNWK